MKFSKSSGMAGLGRLRQWGLVCLLLGWQIQAMRAETMALSWGLVAGRLSGSRRSAVHTDPVESALIEGRWKRPIEGETAYSARGTTQPWRAITTSTNGWFLDRALRGGYAYVPAVVPSDCVMVLEASGDDFGYVNGEPHAGDPYGYGYLHLPVTLHSGTNELLFRCSRGRLKVALLTPTSSVALDLSDPTLPDLILGEKADTWGAVVVVNATSEPRTNLVIRAAIAGEHATETSVPIIPPLSSRKVGFRLRGKAPRTGERLPLQLTLLDRHRPVCSVSAELRLRRPDQTQKRTFISDMDGSVQYWALNPAHPARPTDRPSALFLSLHGASVEAIGQADAYSPKTWGNIVVPTNRRPYGFDWEGWGCLDALEVLDVAQAALHPDPQKIYLTGHSMGGHGTWHLGVLFPGRFAAIGPSAGWVSFFSYAGEPRSTNPTPVEAMLERAVASSDTLALETNYLQEGVYIIHGSADDNVPIGQARTMVEHLSRFHHDFQFHEQPGAGHWWDVSDEPGADCVDWAPLFDFFAHHMIPADQSLRHINFATVNPGLSANCHWLQIQQQVHALEQSTVEIQWDPGKRRFVGTTENVARLELSLNQAQPGQPFKVRLDGQEVDVASWPAEGRLELQNQGGEWKQADGLAAGLKGPRRYGLFKDAFRHRMIFVYGTKGTPAENAWAFDKARLDAESFWYRGNGSVDVIADSAFNPQRDPNRNVILYGNADSNGAWRALLAQSPVQVTAGVVRIGSRSCPGDGQACLFIRPRPGSDSACVGVISGTSLTGMKLTDRLPYFLSGVGYPDLTVIGTEMLDRGSKGVRVAGFFGLDWGVESGEFAWRAD